LRIQFYAYYKGVKQKLSNSTTKITTASQASKQRVTIIFTFCPPKFLQTLTITVHFRGETNFQCASEKHYAYAKTSSCWVTLNNKQINKRELSTRGREDNKQSLVF
jgi:hypothetical protein